MGYEISITDVTLRDGIQNLPTRLSTDAKVQLVEELCQAGVRKLQVTSFVHPKKVPQMADAEAMVERTSALGAEISALILNRKGLARALETPLKKVDLSLSTSETHSLKNTGLTLEEARSQILAMISSAKNNGLRVRVGLQNVFGCYYEGKPNPSKIIALCDILLAEGVEQISLADSSGMATPLSISAMLSRFRDNFAIKPALHLHDTRGLAIANLMAALPFEIVEFDAALGGLGGCNFIPEAAGNIALEDIIHLFDSLGLGTGIDLQQVCKIAKRLSENLGRRLPGKLHQLELPNYEETRVGDGFHA